MPKPTKLKEQSESIPIPIPTGSPEVAIPNSFKLDVFLIEIAGRYGVTGLIAITVIYVFIRDATLKQHQEFVDRWILFKSLKEDNSYFYFVVIILILLFFGQNYFFRQKVKLKDQEIADKKDYIKTLESRIDELKKKKDKI